MTKALILGVYNQDGSRRDIKFTHSAIQFDTRVQGRLSSLVSEFGPHKMGEIKLFYGLHEYYPVVLVVGLGSKDAGYNELEDLDEKRENIRCSIALSIKRLLSESHIDDVLIDGCGDAEASAEGAHLAMWCYDELKSNRFRRNFFEMGVYQPVVNSQDILGFRRGTTLARAQNICRRLSEMPANLMTPTLFCETALELFESYPNIKVVVHDKQWAESKGMGSFLSVAKGSAEPPKFLEVHYSNKPDSKPIVLVGKGVCFDSGGIQIKPRFQMNLMRGHMMGAASVISTTLALAARRCETNVIALVPLCENLPSGTATKPGDVVVAMNGTTIDVTDTDAEGRLILADALCYAHEFEPEAILDVATLTGAMDTALGAGAIGVFSTSSRLFQGLHAAGARTGDRVWRMPLFNLYTNQVTDSQLADCINLGKNHPSGGSCTAAAFLRKFVKCPNWCHLDITGVMVSRDEYPYYARGMTGRPVRTLYYFLNDYYKNNLRV